MHDYSLFFLIQGNCGIEHFHLRQDVCEKFQEYEAIKEQPPSHITIKYDFEANAKQIEELEKTLIQFCNSVEEPSHMELQDYFEHFKQETIYIPATPSELMKEQLADLFTRLKKLDWLTWRKIGDEDIEAEGLILHATIAYKLSSSSKFPEIMEYLQTRKSFEKERLMFNHIALTRVSNGLRQVERVFYLGRLDSQKFRENLSDFGPFNPFRLTQSGNLRIPDLQEDYELERDSLLPPNLQCYATFQNFCFSRSNHIDRVVKIASSRFIDGLEKLGIRFLDLFNIIVQVNFKVFIYGGYLRDIFSFCQLSDDIDVLYTCETALLREISEIHNWPSYQKRDEKTGELRSDFIAIGDKSAKGKFSGHPIGTGCEGEFTMNMLLYDVKERILIDPTGRSIIDAQNRILAIPYPQPEWKRWIDEDRLIGMRLFRFINFRARGFTAESPEMAEFIIQSLKDLFVDETTHKVIVDTLKVFLSRKILLPDADERERKESKFRRMFAHEFDKFYPDEGEAFYQKYIIPHY